MAVDSARARRALAQIQGLTEEVAQINVGDYEAMMESYDKLLLAYAEAAAVVKSELDEEIRTAGANAGEESQAKQARLQFLSSYVIASKSESCFFFLYRVV